MTDLETKIRPREGLEVLLVKLASEGLISHLSVYAQWGSYNSDTIFHASFITPYGQGHSDHKDIIFAINEAIEKAPKEQQKKVQQPAPVVREPIRPAKALRKDERTTPQGQTSVPNLMDLFK